MAAQAKTKVTSKDNLVPVSAPDNTTVLESELGKTHIHQTVVAKIAGLAIREVEGVYSLVPYGAGQRLSSLVNSISGEDMRDLGVAVEVGQVEAAVDCRIITEYGESIPRIALDIQNNVAARLREMTGLVVKEINIEVIDLHFEEDESEQVSALARVK